MTQSLAAALDTLIPVAIVILPLIPLAIAAHRVSRARATLATLRWENARLRAELAAIVREKAPRKACAGQDAGAAEQGVTP